MNAAGLVAQRIERLRPKEGVGGSSPSGAANILNFFGAFSAKILNSVPRDGPAIG